MLVDETRVADPVHFFQDPDLYPVTPKRPDPIGSGSYLDNFI